MPRRSAVAEGVKRRSPCRVPSLLDVRRTACHAADCSADDWRHGFIDATDLDRDPCNLRLGDGKTPSGRGDAALYKIRCSRRKIPASLSFHTQPNPERGSALRDPGPHLGAVVTRRLRAMGIRDKPIASERLIGSIRRERVDHIIVLGRHIRADSEILRY